MNRFLVSISSFLGFQFYTILLQKLNLLPTSFRSSEYKKHKWINTFASFTHSILSSIGCIICYFTNPFLFKDISENHTKMSLLVVSFSWGYFIHDFIHIIMHRKVQKAWDILLHHTVVIVCFGVSMNFEKYVNFACVSLFCEISSSFLHLRQLLKMLSTDIKSLTGNIFLLVNIIVYIFFRTFVFGYMAAWLIENKSILDIFIFYLGICGVIIMNCINTILLYRLIAADFTKKQRHTD